MVHTKFLIGARTSQETLDRANIIIKSICVKQGLIPEDFWIVYDETGALCIDSKPEYPAEVRSRLAYALIEWDGTW